MHDASASPNLPAPLAAPEPSAPPSSLPGRLAALAALAVSGCCLVVSAGMWPLNLEWIPGFTALVILYAVAAAGLWSGRGWARYLGLGTALWGLVCFVQATFVIGPQRFALAGIALHALMLLFTLVQRPAEGGAVDRRHAFAMTCANAALPCALVYGLAPQHDWLVGAGVIGGAAVVVAACAGLGRGRTWGLFAALFGAVLIAVTTARAPAAGWLVHPHPILPNENPLALLGLGVAASSMAFIAVTPYFGPIVRFLMRPSSE